MLLPFQVVIFIFVLLNFSCSEDTNGVVREEVLRFCNHDDYSETEVIDCLIKALDNCREPLVHGDPDVGMPVLDPLSLQEVTLQEGSGQVIFTVVMKNVKMAGLSDFVIKNLNVDYQAMTLNGTLHIPQGKVTGFYEVAAEVFYIPIKGNGTLWFTVDDLIVSIEGTLKIAENKLFIEVQHLDFTFGNVAMRLNNLFNGDPTLGEIINTFVNENARDILEEVRPVITKTLLNILSELLLGMADNVEISEFPGHKYLRQ